jgi:putative peptide maturation dehydrogenase
VTAVRRPRHTVAFIAEREVIDLAGLLRGEMSFATEDRLIAINLAESREEPVTPEELQALFSLSSSSWTPLREAAATSGFSEEGLDDLARRGLLLSDRDEEPFRELRRRHEAIAAGAWDPWAAIYHFMGRWELGGISTPEEQVEAILAQSREWFDRMAARHGPPPGEFYERPDAVRQIPLPSPRRSDGLFGLLRGRRTERSFDRCVSLRLEDFAAIVETVYGCQGYLAMSDQLRVLKKTSPSAGALHPVEVYPLVRDVEGLEPGLYHYAVRTHRLELLRAMAAEEVADTIEAITSGQSYYRWAHAAFVLSARFYRTFWKYRGHSKAYRVVLLDAGHLSQTFYLVCRALGLGAFFTATLDDGAAEKALGLDRCSEGVVGVSGCGLVAAGADALAFLPEPYVPGETDARGRSAPPEPRRRARGTARRARPRPSAR